MRRTFILGVVSSLALTSAATAEIRIAYIYGKTGALEAYAMQSHDGLLLGLIAIPSTSSWLTLTVSRLAVSMRSLSCRRA